MFPLGTILLGFASFGIWMWKKDRVEDRNLRYASAMRQVPGEAGWRNRLDVLKAISAGSEADRLASTASYLESSLGGEGMGYSPERFVVGLDAGQPVGGVVVELTGKQRPREIVLVLMSYGDAQKVAKENEALASFLTLANWLTGEPVVRTLRFAALPLSGMDDSAKREVMVRFGEEMRRRNERVMQVVDLSAVESELNALTVEALQMAASGAVSRREVWPGVVDESAGGYGGVRELLLGLAERP
jgi:hypothetical protein